MTDPTQEALVRLLSDLARAEDRVQQLQQALDELVTAWDEDRDETRLFNAMTAARALATKKDPT